MRSRQRAPWRLYVPSVVLVACSLLASCASGSGSVRVGSATATPLPTFPVATPTLPGLTAPTLHELNLGDFQAQAVYPLSHGLLLVGKPADQGTTLGQTGLAGIFFYDFASQSIQTLARPAVAPDGTPRRITGLSPAGDWITFGTGDFGGAHWELRTVNVVTHEQRLLDSYLQEQDGPNAVWTGLVTSDGSEAVWSAFTQSAEAPGWILRAYTFASGTTRTLLSGPATPSTGPLAMANGTILFTEKRPTPTASDGVYLWTLTDPAPKQISTDEPVNGGLSDQYAVWDDSHTLSLALFDRSTGQVTDAWDSSCIRPDVAHDRPYVVCIDFNSFDMRLVRVPTDQSVVLGKTIGAENGAIADGRTYWVKSSPSDSNNIVDYVDLPAA